MSGNNNTIENVLILQGGGSLGAFSCGVFKALVNNNIKIDIISGTSIGGVNAAIIAGSKEEYHPEKVLEQFWLELGENSINLDSCFVELLSLYPKVARVDRHNNNDPLRSVLSFYSSTMYGNSKLFIPRWRPDFAYRDPQYFTPGKWSYLYDHSPLVKTLEKYIDYKKLQPNGKKPNARLIMTAVNVLTAEPLIFDSSKQQITPKHILATSGYPLYYFPWIEVEKGVYAWDGSLLSNTPLREVIDVSPVADKQVFLVENYPKNIDRLPTNLPEANHRARDIMFSDKTLHTVHMSKAITYYLKFIDELYSFIKDNHLDSATTDKRKAEKISAKYKRITQHHGAEIKGIYHITREESFPYLYENADFSLQTIKDSINEGELKTNNLIKNIQWKGHTITL
jgi:NTE family protein